MSSFVFSLLLGNCELNVDIFTLYPQQRMTVEYIKSWRRREYRVLLILYEETMKLLLEERTQRVQVEKDLNIVIIKCVNIKWLMFTFTYVQNFEDEFKKFEHENNISFSYDHTLVAYFDKMEERRRQRWYHYLNNPPSDTVRLLVSDARVLTKMKLAEQSLELRK